MPKMIVITGPESTGKTTLTKVLSKKFEGIGINEYAREYIEKKTVEQYVYEDVVHIMEHQYEEFQSNTNSDKAFVFFDTYLIITKIWFEVVFK
ncbi:AAA family ATPase, partial [Bacteroidota bacterium]